MAAGTNRQSPKSAVIQRQRIGAACCRVVVRAINALFLANNVMLLACIFLKARGAGMADKHFMSSAS